MVTISGLWERMRRPAGRDQQRRAAIRELESLGFRAMAQQPNVFVQDRPEGRIKVYFFDEGGMAQHHCDGKLKIEIGTLDEVMGFVRPLLVPGEKQKPRPAPDAVRSRRDRVTPDAAPDSASP